MLYGRYLDWNTMLTFGHVINMKGQSDEYILQVLAANYPSLDYQNVPARKLRKKINAQKEDQFRFTNKGSKPQMGLECCLAKASSQQSLVSWIQNTTATA